MKRKMTMFRKLPIASAVALAVAMPAQAVDFDLGPFRVSVDSTLSLGATMRLQDPDARFIHPGNMEGGQGHSGVADDGNLNYESGDLTSFVFRGIHDISLDAGHYGAFIRFNYWYDDILKNENVPHGHTANNYQPDRRLRTDAFDSYAEASGIQLLDAYAYYSFDWGDVPTDLRIGRQVLSWGESTFIQNGINSINPADVNAVRRPGAEVREALLPVGMVSASFGLTNNLSLDTFWMFEWDNTKLDGCGSFFSTVDIVGGPGCNKVTLNPEVGPGNFLSDQESVEAGLYVARAGDREASDSGQFGLSMRYYSLDLDTEFGFYYMNVHNTQPIISAYDWRTNDQTNNVVGQLGPRYFIEWPEDNEIFGASFATNLGAWSWAGEVSYRPNQAVQINTTEILTAGVQPDVPSSFSDRIEAARPDGNAVGNYAAGFEELEVWQAQMTFINFFERALNTDRISLVAEVGMNHVADLPALEEQRFGRNPVFGKCQTPTDLGLGDVPGANYRNCEGFVTQNSWGYRTALAFEYNNAFMGWNLTPTITFNHDVSGYSPNPNFIEGRRNLGLALNGSLRSTYDFTLSYNRYAGADYDPFQDRDHLSFNFSVAF